MLKKLKFKVLFSSEQIRQNLKDYIFRIYKSILEEVRAQENSAEQQPINQQIFKAYIKLHKNKKILEINASKIVGSNQCLILLKEVSSY